MPGETERLRDLLVPVLENPRQAGELHWTGVSSMDISRSSWVWRWVTATVRYLHELGYICGCLGPGRTPNEEQRNAFLDQLRRWQAELAWSYGLSTNAGWRAILARGGAGAFGAGGLEPYLGDHIRANVLGRCADQWRMLHDDL